MICALMKSFSQRQSIYIWGSTDCTRNWPCHPRETKILLFPKTNKSCFAAHMLVIYLWLDCGSGIQPVPKRKSILKWKCKSIWQTTRMLHFPQESLSKCHLLYIVLLCCIKTKETNAVSSSLKHAQPIHDFFAHV